MTLFEKHKTTIGNAVKALHDRTFFAYYPEHPAPAIYGETADADAQAKFKSALGKKFEELKQPAAETWIGEEESPYLQEALRIQYPAYSVQTLVDTAKKSISCMEKNFY